MEDTMQWNKDYLGGKGIYWDVPYTTYLKGKTNEAIIDYIDTDYFDTIKELKRMFRYKCMFEVFCWNLDKEYFNLHCFEHILADAKLQARRIFWTSSVQWNGEYTWEEELEWRIPDYRDRAKKSLYTMKAAAKIIRKFFIMCMLKKPKFNFDELCQSPKRRRIATPLRATIDLTRDDLNFSLNF